MNNSLDAGEMLAAARQGDSLLLRWPIKRAGPENGLGGGLKTSETASLDGEEVGYGRETERKCLVMLVGDGCQDSASQVIKES